MYFAQITPIFSTLSEDESTCLKEAWKACRQGLQAGAVSSLKAFESHVMSQVFSEGMVCHRTHLRFPPRSARHNLMAISHCSVDVIFNGACLPLGAPPIPCGSGFDQQRYAIKMFLQKISNASLGV